MQNASTASRLDANVIALSPEQPGIEIVEGQLQIRSFALVKGDGSERTASLSVPAGMPAPG
jgi:hypothetical protein